ncbi:MAG TPA: YqgE/AlgH family protein, partial [Caulobacteraceae bacterium]
MPLPKIDGDFLTGRLLVAMPGIDDPRFERAVLYVCAHNDEHAMGLAVNRPVEGLTVPDLLERLGVQSNIRLPDDLVMMGGPVERERG